MTHRIDPGSHPTVIGPPTDLHLPPGSDVPDLDATEVIAPPHIPAPPPVPSRPPTSHVYQRPPPTPADRRRAVRWPIVLIVGASLSAAVFGWWMGTPLDVPPATVDVPAIPAPTLATPAPPPRATVTAPRTPVRQPPPAVVPTTPPAPTPPPSPSPSPSPVRCFPPLTTCTPIPGG